MESSGLPEDIESGTKIEVIGVAENDLGVNLVAELVCVHGLDAAHCADGHEYRCRYLAVVGGDDPGAGIAAGCKRLYPEFHSFLIIND